MLKRIDYNGGYLWVDKKAKIKVGDTYVLIATNGIDDPTYLVRVLESNYKPFGYKVIVQSPNLLIPNVPYVESIEEYNKHLSMDLICSIVKNRHKYTDIKYKEALERAQNIYKPTQSKGRYSEDDLRKAIRQGEINEGCTACAKTDEEFIASLNQPPLEIEIEMYNESEYIKNSPTTFYKTYERDGKTYLKVKS